MRVSANNTHASGKGNGTMAGINRDSESGTLSAMSKEAADKLVKRVNARRSTRTKKHDDLEQCAASPRSSLERKGKQVSDTRVSWNDLDGRNVVEDSRVHCSREADKGGSQINTCNIDEEMEDADWEDGSTRLSSLNNQHVDSISELTIEFNNSPLDSTPRKAVRRATAKEKELAELVHKVHLLCLLARGRIIDNACDDPLIQASLLSLLPENLSKISKISKLAASDLAPLVRWFHSHFRVSSSFSERGAFRSALYSAIKNCEGTPEEVAALSVALLRALGLTARFVSILDVVCIKPEADVCESSTQDVNQVRRNIFKTATLMVDKTMQVLSSPVVSFTENQGENACENSAKTPNDSKDIHKDSSVTGKVKNQLLESTASEINEDISEKPSTSTSLGAKRKGDLEFELQLQMALSATAAATPHTNIESDIQRSNSNLSETYTLKRLRRITGGEPFSQGVSTAVGSRKIGPPLCWAEVFCSGENLTGKWVHVDAVNTIVDGEDRVEAAAAACKTPLRYVVAFAGSGAKDVTRRYCKKWHKIALQRVNSCWWDAVLAPLRELESGATGGHVKLSGEPFSSEVSIDSEGNLEVGSSGTNTFSATRDSMEDMELETRALTEPLPTNQQAYRSHLLYAIERWLTKCQILHPRGPVLGFCSGHPVYPRSCVQLLKTKYRWLREALQVKANELPAKVLKQSKRLKKVEHCEEDDYAEVGSNGTIELYGRWQLEPLQLPLAVNGIVPKNERGQVDVWSEKCLPPGTVHIRLPRVFQIAKRLEIDYAPAMVGFDFKNGRAVPIFDGIVVCSEFKDVILEAYAEEEERREAVEKKRNEAQAVSRWYQLLSSIVTRQRLSNTYGNNQMPEAPTRVEDAQAAGVNRQEEVPPKCQEKNMKHFKRDVPLEGHEHVFLAEDQTFDESSSVRTKRCRCGFSVQVEEL